MYSVLAFQSDETLAAALVVSSYAWSPTGVMLDDGMDNAWWNKCKSQQL